MWSGANFPDGTNGTNFSDGTNFSASIMRLPYSIVTVQRVRSKHSSAAVSRGATICEDYSGYQRYIRDMFVMLIHIRKAWIYLLLLLLLLLLKFCQKYISLYLGHS